MSQVETGQKEDQTSEPGQQQISSNGVEKRPSMDPGAPDPSSNGVEKRPSIDPNIPDPLNPYHFPPFAVFRGVTYNGAAVFHGPVKDDPITHVKNIRALPMRDDDVMIAAFPKCGTHWVSEITHMLMSGTADYNKRTKEFTMLEFVPDLPALANDPSPRLLNSHLQMVHLPKEIVEKKIKIIHVIRNPKDTAVSMFHHLKQAANDKFNFDNFLKGYTSDNYLTTSNQFAYLRQMTNFEREHPDHPIIHIHYEDLKRDPVPLLQELSRFLGTPASEDFCLEVAEACGFNNMKSLDEHRDMPEHITNSMPNKRKLRLYRKGIIGDWKTSFTVAQNELYDEFIEKNMKLGLDVKFRDH